LSTLAGASARAGSAISSCGTVRRSPLIEGLRCGQTDVYSLPQLSQLLTRPILGEYDPRILVCHCILIFYESLPARPPAGGAVDEPRGRANPTPRARGDSHGPRALESLGARAV